MQITIKKNIHKILILSPSEKLQNTVRPSLMDTACKPNLYARLVKISSNSLQNRGTDLVNNIVSVNHYIRHTQ